MYQARLNKHDVVSVAGTGIVLFFYLFISSSVFAQPAKTVYSKANPAGWTTGSHWSLTSGGGACSCVPDPSKDIIYVETPTNSAAGITFGASVTLYIRNSSTFTITGNAVFSNGSIIVIESGSSLIITGNLVNNNNSNQITIDGSISVGGNFDGGNGSAISGAGTMSVTGTATTTGSGTVFGSNGSCSGCSISPSSPLPVEFLFFSAEVVSGSVQLRWLTAAEFNSDYFVVQRSRDGQSFEEIARQEAAGNSNTVKHYSAEDKEPYSGTAYYRLKQVDHDGKFMFSDLVVVKFQREDFMTVYPNPSSGPFQVSIEAPAGHEMLIVIRDVLGRECYSKMFVLSSDRELIGVDPDRKLAPGVYQVVAVSENNLEGRYLVIR